jgi:hypothetical protein
MKKHAFIVTYPEEKGEKNYCQGVLQDKVNLKNYLMSAVGGAWHDSEISTFENTLKPWLISALEQCKGYDYLLIFFSGHGYFNGSETCIELSKYSEMSEESLVGYAKKELIILDCCRVYHPGILLDHKLTELMKALGPGINPAACREKYESDIENCGNTLTKCYSCKTGETSIDDPQEGGLYLSNLVECAAKKEKFSARYGAQMPVTFSINEIHQEAESIVTRRSRGRQNPKIKREKLQTEFPFAVLAQ